MNMRLHYLLLLVYFFGYYQVSSQNPILNQIKDSLSVSTEPEVRATLFRQLAYELRIIDRLQGHIYLDSSLAIAEKRGLQNVIPRIYGTRAVFFTIDQKRDSAISNYEKAYSGFQALSDTIGMSSTITNMGRLESILGNYYKAIEYYKKSNEVGGHDNPVGVLTNLISIASEFTSLSIYDSALRNYQNAEQIFLNLPSSQANRRKELLGVIYGNTGIVYSKIEEFNLAKEQYYKSEAIALELSDYRQIASVNTNLGDLFLDVGRLDSAYARFKIAERNYELSAYPEGRLITAINFGRYFLEKEQFVEAFKIANDSYSDSKKLSNKIYEFQLARILGVSSNRMGNFSNALLYFESVVKNPVGDRDLLLDAYNELIIATYSEGLFERTFNTYQAKESILDSLRIQSTEREIRKLAYQYETLKTQQENIRQKELLVNQEIRISQDARLKFYLYSLIALSLVLAFTIYVAYHQTNNRKKEAQRAENEAKKAKSLQEQVNRHMGHSVSNNLSALSSFLKNNGKQALPASEFVNRALINILDIHEYTQNIPNNRKVELGGFIKKRVERYVALHNKKNVRVVIDIEKVFTSDKNIIWFGAIIDETVHNAFKYAFRNDSIGTLKIVLRNEGENWILEIIDDGTGFNNDSSRNRGFGLSYIEEASENLGGKSRLLQEKGTHWFVTISNKTIVV